MRRLGAILAFAVLLAACTSRQQPTTHKGRIISVTDFSLSTGGTDTVRFGHMRSGEIVQQRLRLANNTDHPLVITSYDRTCGCVTLDFNNQPIKPGEEQLLTLSFDSRGERGWQLKTIGIRFAAIQQPLRIYIEADVE